MKSEKEKIETLEKELSRLKMGFNQVMEAVKEESINYKSTYLIEVARRLMCFYFGQHINSINIGDKFAKAYTIREGQKWVSGTHHNGFVSDNSIHIYADNTRSGFICGQTGFVNAFTDDDLTDIWIWYCKKRHFRGSFLEFTNCCKGVSTAPICLDLIAVYNDYLENQDNVTDFVLEIFNEPTIKIENMVLCIINYR